MQRVIFDYADHVSDHISAQKETEHRTDAPVVEKVYRFSVQNYDRPLCFKCQQLEKKKQSDEVDLKEGYE